MVIVAPSGRIDGNAAGTQTLSLSALTTDPWIGTQCEPAAVETDATPSVMVGHVSSLPCGNCRSRTFASVPDAAWPV